MVKKGIIDVLAFRVLIAVLTRTFFQPDEYFQALEPAHHLVFGYGTLTWEWSNPSPIRSFLYPALNVPIYWALKITGLDAIEFWGPWLVVLGPKILHGILASGTDIWLYDMTRRNFGSHYASVALLLSLSSFFNALSLSRSLSNSLETTLATIAYAYYPWSANRRDKAPGMRQLSSVRTCLVFSALACAVRPTNVVIWVFLFGRLLLAWRRHRTAFVDVVTSALATGTGAVVLVVWTDYLYYGRLVFTPVNFFITNLSGVSLFYSRNPWHYYFSQALIVLCCTVLPFVVLGLLRSLQGTHVAAKAMSVTVLWTMTIYSFVGHKEWRFVHPILPLLHALAAKFMWDSTQAKGKALTYEIRTILNISAPYFYLILLQIPLAVYSVMFYCSGPISVMSFIRNLPTSDLSGGSLGFLMPCHSTPGHAYLHRPELAHGGMWSLGCEPPLNGQNISTYHDQTDIFFEAPIDYMMRTFPPTVDPNFPMSPFPANRPGAPPQAVKTEKYPWVHEWPKHFVFFGSLLEREGMQNLLEGNGYEEVWREGRSWEGDGSNRKGGVRVWKWMA